MVINFTSGKIILTMHEIVVRLNGDQRITMQAQVDAVQLIGKGANVISVNGAECKWSFKLDSEQQLREIAQELSIAIIE
ncbi:PTS sugar transporter subunit IIA [Vibrio sp. 10N.286.49.B3]|uniref:DUF3389 domain-containing protein n=1 Tax=Vibrio sp. 10N.286.49.B3 TaxID=1880855 RepID=UPI000C81F176|nr:DUF3389 domain-containing protein [Vibrio sp. 10N.286.49.B3]PMH41416.1 PTS sugar transporter subunit IIA [Vibrio sp. 10N.286.49.B3]